jgi:hypothetical protein
MTLVEHVAHMEEKCVQDFGGGYLKKRGLLEAPTHRCYSETVIINSDTFGFYPATLSIY